MKIRTLGFALLCFFLQSANTYSQSFSYRRTEFEWAQGRPISISTDPMFAKEDAVILDEKCIYNISGNTVPPYKYIATAGNIYFIDESSIGKSPVVQKHLRIRFLTQEGIRKFSNFVLPESFDPLHDLMVTPPEKRDSIRRTRGEFECVRYFAARIFKPDGRIVAANISESTEKELTPRHKINMTFYSWIFQITNLEVGDELELDYSYEGSFTYSPSLRIYFNSEMPKQNYELTLRESQKQVYMHFDHNGAKAVDSIFNTNGKLKYRDYIYRVKNLKGGITESSSRPVNELPYVTFYSHLSDYGEFENNSPVLTNALPYPWWFVLSRKLGFQYENLKIKLMWTDKTTSEMNKFIKKERMKLPNTPSAVFMSGIQHTIAEDFDYSNDINYIEGNDARLERLGSFVEEKKLRYISREHFYDQIFLRLDTTYYLAVVPDKRTDNLNPAQYENLGRRSEFYVLPVQDQFLFFYPKASRFGYEANEFPFYFEGVTAALVPQYLPAEMKTDILPRVEYPFTRTPESSYSENTRKTFAMVSVSLDSLKISTSGKLKLRGQFSTMTRGFYLYGDKDTTVNTAYYKTIKDLADPGKEVQIIKSDISSHFPFEANFNFSFTKNGFIKKETEGTYSFSLDGWFNNVIDEEFHAEKRNLNYYPDFKSEDTHRYMVKFDHPVKLANTELTKDTIANAYGYYILSVEQKDDQNILIETTLIVNTDMVTSGKAKDVEAIFEKIKNWNRRKFVVRKV